VPVQSHLDEFYQTELRSDAGAFAFNRNAYLSLGSGTIMNADQLLDASDVRCNSSMGLRSQATGSIQVLHPACHHVISSTSMRFMCSQRSVVVRPARRTAASSHARPRDASTRRRGRQRTDRHRIRRVDCGETYSGSCRSDAGERCSSGSCAHPCDSSTPRTLAASTGQRPDKVRRRLVGEIGKGSLTPGGNCADAVEISAADATRASRTEGTRRRIRKNSCRLDTTLRQEFCFC